MRLDFNAEMDRNSIIGLGLIFAIVVGYILLTQSNAGEIEARKKQETEALAQKRKEDSLKQVAALQAKTTTTTADSATKDSIQAAAPTGSFGKLANGAVELVTLENDVIKVQFSTKGGHPYSVELKKYKRALQEGQTEKDRKPVVLFEGNQSNFNLSFVTVDGFTDSTSRLFFAPSSKKVTVTGDSGTLSLKAAVSDSQYFEQVYWLKPGSYELFYTLRLKGVNKLLSANHRFMQLDWRMDMPLQEKSIEDERKATSVYYSGVAEGVNDFAAIAKEEKRPEDNLRWFAFKQKFFNSTLISLSGDGFDNALLGSDKIANPNAPYVGKVQARAMLPTALVNDEALNMKFYFGPNKYDELKKLDLEMDRMVQMGWGIFGWINKLMILPLFKALSNVTGNFGIIILIMTLIIKALLFGLVYKSYISSAKMKILKPEIDELKAKHGENLQKFQQEQMALFKKAGVSPLGGCLPLLLQMPFLIAMFQFFPSSIELRQQSFLWASDLSTFDSIWTFGKVPLISDIYGDHVSLFTVLMTISTLIYTLFNNQLTGVTGQMKYIGYIMPIFFLGFFNNYASGLTYYYFLTNIVSIAQQFIIRRFVDEDALHKKIQENKKKPVKKSAFQTRLEEMAKKRGIDPTKRR